MNIRRPIAHFWKRDWPIGLAILLLGIHACLAVASLHQQCVTMDEFQHLPAGISYWRTGSFFAYRVNPPLVKMLAALPVLLRLPRGDFEQHIPDTNASDERAELSHRFLEANRDDYFDLFFVARYPIVLLSLLGGWGVFLWARELFGNPAGVIGVGLWALCPNVLAHGQLITADVGATVAIIWASFIFWRWLRKPTWKQAVLAGVFLGIAELTKFTNLVLFPVWGALWLASMVAPSSSSDESLSALSERPATRSIRRETVQLVSIVFLSLLVLNAGYAFEGTFTRLGDFPFKSQGLVVGRVVAMPSSEEVPTAKSRTYELIRQNRFKGKWLTDFPVPLPKYYVLGIDLQKKDFEPSSPSGYLRGEFRQGGWWYYYLYGLGVKLPLGTLALFVVAVGLAIFDPRFRRGPLPELAFILPGTAVLVLVSSQTGYNAHLRYVLPFFPFFFVFISRLGIAFTTQPVITGMESNAAMTATSRLVMVRCVIASCLLWNAVAALRIHPHYLSYFNEMVGGPDNGGRHLLDSNIDWGQDLFFLKRWLDQNPQAKPLGLAYFGRLDPTLVGIEYDLPPFGNVTKDQFGAMQQPIGPKSGWFAVSVNFVYGSGGDAYTYFQRFQPVAKAGYSIYIYHITEDQANEIRRTLGFPPLGAEKEIGVHTEH